MSTERWYATRRVGMGQYVKLFGQPREGFPAIDGAMGWLIDRGLIRRLDHPDGETWIGWGTEYFASNAAQRDDPWEPAHA